MTRTNQKIPEGWSVKKLGEIGTFVSGGTPDTEKAEYWNGDIIWLTPSEITKLKTRFVSDSERKITKLGLKNSSAVLLPKNSLIICTRATIGDCCINTKEVSTNQGFKNLIPNNNCTDFLYYLISIHKSDLIRRACGSTFLEISKHDIEKLKYVFPPLAEQKKIAEILSCWDEGIEKLSALIEKKKIQKKALMQQLLTGKHRLKGFSTPWHEVKLGDIAEKITRKNLNQYTNVVTISAQNGFILQQQFFSKSVAGEDLLSYNLLKCGEFGYNRSYSKGFPMGAIKRLDLFDVAPVSSLYICFSVNEYIDSNFMVNYFDAGLQNYELYKVAQEGARNHGLLNISLHDFFNIKLYIPSSLAEQKAIADILSKADEEIELLNKKLAAFKLEKKALMQKLLTGKIRVKVN